VQIGIEIPVCDPPWLAVTITGLDYGRIPFKLMHVLEIQLVLIQIDPTLGFVPFVLWVHCNFGQGCGQKLGANGYSPLRMRVV
jgi:hypothetical protein